MFMILICHLGTQYSIGFIAELFVIGVEVFFFISGYLNNVRKTDSAFRWEMNRIRRIYIPVVVFCLFLALAAFIFGYSGNYLGILPCVSGVYGVSKIFPHVSIVGFPGLTHLWFITVMLICYLLVPVFDAVNNRWNRPRVILYALIVLQVLLAFFSIRISYIVIFYVGYLTRYEDMHLDQGKQLVSVNILLVIACGIRLVGKSYLDDSLIYLSFIIPFTNNAIASVLIHDLRAILRVGRKCLLNEHVMNVVSWFDSISYEVYIVHYTFIAGIFSTFMMNANEIIKIGMFLVLTFVSAAIVHFISEKIGLFFYKRKVVTE